jgi:hypothetical protein
MKVVVALVVLAGVALCCIPPHCENVDMGTCGNACCSVTIPFLSGITAMNVLVALESTFPPPPALGPDGHFTLQGTAETNGKPGFADLRQYNLTAQFIGQLWHSTPSLAFNDTLNLVVYKDSLTIFSISQIGGALGDQGQNYKNIWTVYQAIEPYFATTPTITFGCGKGNKK